MFSPLSKDDIPFILSAKEYGFNDVWDEKMLLSAFSSGRFFGYVINSENKKAGFITFDKGTDEADIEDVFIFPEFRKRGYGKLLVKKVLCALRDEGFKKVFLEVRKSNTVARGLYERFGFNKINERKKYYFDGEDAVVYLKEF